MQDITKNKESYVLDIEVQVSRRTERGINGGNINGGSSVVGETNQGKDDSLLRHSCAQDNRKSQHICKRIRVIRPKQRQNTSAMQTIQNTKNGGI